jgi:hypothetical protein
MPKLHTEHNIRTRNESATMWANSVPLQQEVDKIEVRMNKKIANERH